MGAFSGPVTFPGEEPGVYETLETYLRWIASGPDPRAGVTVELLREGVRMVLTPASGKPAEFLVTGSTTAVTHRSLSQEAAP